MAAEVRGQYTTERMPLMVIHDHVFSVLLERVDIRFLSSTDVLTSFLTHMSPSPSLFGNVI